MVFNLGGFFFFFFFFAGKGMYEFKNKGSKIPDFYRKKKVTLNITNVKYTINFQIISFMVQNKTQIAFNSKENTRTSNHTSLYIKNVTSNISDKKWSYKEN